MRSTKNHTVINDMKNFTKRPDAPVPKTEYSGSHDVYVEGTISRKFALFSARKCHRCNRSIWLEKVWLNNIGPLFELAFCEKCAKSPEEVKKYSIIERPAPPIPKKDF